MNKQDWKEKKEAEKKETLNMMNNSVKEIVQDPERFKSYLKLQGIFDRYSVSNVLLISSQKPDATRLKDFDSWAEEKRRVIKGQKGISILQPEMYVRPDGTEGTSYNVKKVFDVSQVSGVEPLEFSMNPVRFADALVRTFPYPVQEVERLDFDNNGVYYNDQQNCLYTVKGEKGDPQFCQFLALEVSYAEVVSELPAVDQESANFLAKCVACTVCSKYGQSISSFDFDDIPKSWQQLEPKEVRRQLDMIRGSANRIIARASEALYHKHQKDDLSL